MDILKLEDNGEMTIEITEEENNFFVQYAVVDILRKEIERIKNEQGTDRNRTEVQSKESSERNSSEERFL